MQYGSLSLRAAVAVIVVAASTSVQADLPRYRVENLGSILNNTQPFGLNNLGQVVGTRYFGTSTDPQGFIYSQGQVSRIDGLGFLPNLLDINDRGDIVGGTSLPAGNRQAFLFRDGRAHQPERFAGPRRPRDVGHGS